MPRITVSQVYLESISDSLWKDSYGISPSFHLWHKKTNLKLMVFILIQKDNLITAWWLMLHDYYNVKYFFVKSLQSILTVGTLKIFILFFIVKTPSIVTTAVSSLISDWPSVYRQLLYQNSVKREIKKNFINCLTILFPAVFYRQWQKNKKGNFPGESQ